ncbi:DUF3139 domain-containing protein [Neobacillus rhizophilus]|uniref:DUF3139 domain-containing protein n=1 Tax=Neobacillus rhizophilus TaxID=2833579 RepID=A0A942U734_9BACI|nr:DUF3139 domain-containing protein [Neobacillus rhizophilus]MBS4214595.1 DUF3139 domain-containing protein [Neobacillus rhizophilus]
MKRTRKIFRVTLLVLLVGIIIVPIITIQTNKFIYKNRVSNYLVEEEGIDRDDIESIKGKWGFKLPSYYVIVTFKNEPQVEYIYFAQDNDVFQSNYKLNEQGQKEGIKEEDLKNLNPRY